jgi:hypothetical protein
MNRMSFFGRGKRVVHICCSKRPDRLRALPSHCSMGTGYSFPSAQVVWGVNADRRVGEYICASTGPFTSISCTGGAFLFFFFFFFFLTWSCFAHNYWEFQICVRQVCKRRNVVHIPVPQHASFPRLTEQMWTAFCETVRRIVSCEFNLCWTQCKLIKSTVLFIERKTVTVIVDILQELYSDVVNI